MNFSKQPLEQKPTRWFKEPAFETFSAVAQLRPLNIFSEIAAFKPFPTISANPLGRPFLRFRHKRSGIATTVSGR